MSKRVGLFSLEPMTRRDAAGYFWEIIYWGILAGFFLFILGAFALLAKILLQ